MSNETEDQGTNRPQIVISLSDDERDLFEAWARNQGKSLSGWAREVLIAALPPEVVRQRLRIGPPQDLGRQEQSEPDLNNDQRTLFDAPRVTEHSCAWLRRIFPGHLGPNQCRGTCANPKTAGKPCHWSSGQAPQCSYYAQQYYQGGANHRP